MKILQTCVAILILSGVLIGTSCKKYGYKFEDGFVYGQDSSNVGNISSDPLAPDFSKLDKAREFPGLVGPTEPRINTSVAINFSVEYVPPVDIKVYNTPQLLFSTGLYAPAGEPIIIEVPQGVTGLIAQIGGWTDNLSAVSIQKRDPIVFNQMALRPGKNYMKNLYGGAIYIKSNNLIENIGTVTLGFERVVKSPDFVLGETSNAQWAQMVSQSSVPWFQLRGKNIIFELPKMFLDKHPIADPTALMEEWDRIIDQDIYKWKGLEDVTADSLDRAPQMPVRVIMDVQPKSGTLNYAHSSYPVVVQLDENLFKTEITSLNYLTTKGAFRTLAEIGRNNICYAWVWSAITAPAAHFNSLKMAKRLNIPYNNLDRDMQLAIDTAIWYTFDANPTTIYTANFTKDINGRTNSELIKVVPFMQLFDYYGFGLLTYVDDKARHLQKPLSGDQEKINFFYKCVSEFAGKNMFQFFRRWGIYVSSDATSAFSGYVDLDSALYNYSPVLKDFPAGVAKTVPAATKEIDRISWSIVDFCCQETDLPDFSFFASNVLDGLTETVWSTAYILPTNPVHYDHYITFDFGKLNDVRGFWFQNGPNYRPRNIKVYVSADKNTWYQAYVGTATSPPNNSTLQSLTFNRTPTGATGAYTYTNMRYMKFQAYDSYTSHEKNLVRTAEIGALKP